MKIKQLLLAAAAMVFAVACNETPDEPGVTPTPEVQVSVLPNTLSVAYTGAENSVLVNAKGAWTATADADWITVEPASGEAGAVQVKVTVAKSDVAEARTGKVVFAVGEEKAELAVEQQAAPEAGSDVWGIAGSHQNWAPADAPAMEYADGYYFQKDLEFAAGTEFKFVKDNAWTVNRGYSGSKPMTANYFYAVEHNGGNIKVLTAGTYDIYLNADASVFYLMEAGKLPAEAQDSETLEDAVVPDADKGWRVVGTHNGWNKDGEDVNMTLSNGLWAATGVTMDKTDETSGLVEFKFVQDRDWNKTVGVDNDAELAVNCFYAAGGSNIKVATGTYDLYLSEDATKFYVMAAGVDPSTAQDATGGGDAAGATASITIRESEMAEQYIAFNLTTENVVAASWGVLATELVDETITAEYILSEDGGYALAEDELNTTVETGYRRGVAAGTEYTIFLAYEDAAGNKAMVTATVTTPGGGDVLPDYFAINATELSVLQDDLYGDAIITFFGEDYDLVVNLNTLDFVGKDLYFVVEQGEVGVTGAFVRDHSSMETVENAVGGEFGLYTDPEYGYYVTAMFNGESGASIEAVYAGNIEGLGGGAAVGGDIDFVVSAASVARSAELPDDGSIWEVTLTSTDNDTLVLVFDTSMDDAPILIGAPYPVIAVHGSDYGIVQWASYGAVSGTQCMFMQSTDFLTVNTMYDGVNAETDKYTFDGKLSAVSYTGDTIGTINVSTPNALSLYSSSVPATPVDYEWEWDYDNPKVTARALIDTEFGETEFHLINEEAGAQISIYVNTANVVDQDFYLEDDTYGSDAWITYACIRDLQGKEITKLANVEFSVYSSWTTPGAFYIGCYADTEEGGNVSVDFDGMVDGLVAEGGEVAEKIFVVTSATAERSEEYPDDASVWYLELTSTTGDVIGLTFDQIEGSAPIFIGGTYSTVGYVNGETQLIDQALSWNEFGGAWKASEGDALSIQMQPLTEDYSNVAYIFAGSLTAIDSVSGSDTYYVTFQTEAPYVTIEYTF